MQKSKIKKIKITNNEDRIAWEESSPAQYEKAIWQSIIDYNYKAQLDIATIILQSYNAGINNDPDFIHKFEAVNLVFRMMQLYYETADQFHAVCEMILNRDNKEYHQPVYLTYSKLSSNKSKKFFERCANGGIADHEVQKIWGLYELANTSIQTKKDKTSKKIQTLISDTTKGEKDNLKILGRKYINIDVPESPKTSALLGSESVKHGFKAITHNQHSRKFLKSTSGELAIVQGTKTVYDETSNSTKQLMVFGFASKPENFTTTATELHNQIMQLSLSIRIISELQLIGSTDPLLKICHLDELRVIKLERNSRCFCNNGKNFKKCHKQKYQNIIKHI
ncbi:SEC-C domain-containing protein [candidate division WWE3 bacterium]|uniref:SEC-C domain-containing protein n=1 Tax=candidate division WWE3 bacterium TaxID=2053526 RepID=A0A955LVA3_UNCKA|nr:SEC-C domain-containing protein [candidate division WWE3 bacterium]